MESNTMSYAGSGWVRSQGWGEVSPFGELVANILGQAFLGIYHLSPRCLKKADWSSPNFICLSHYGALATWDFNELTRLVVLCHDACVRLAVRGVGPGYVRLEFSWRDTREGSIIKRHPTLEENVQLIRDTLGVPAVRFEKES